MPLLLLPISAIIKEAKKKEISLGYGKPYNRIRYLIKIGILPNAKRLRIIGTTHIEGHLPSNTLEIIQLVNNLKDQGISPLDIKKQLRSPQKNEQKQAVAEDYVRDDVIVEALTELANAMTILTKINGINQSNNIKPEQNISEVSREENKLGNKHISDLLSRIQRTDHAIKAVVATSVVIILFFALGPKILGSDNNKDLKSELKKLALQITTEPRQIVNNYQNTTNNNYGVLGTNTQNNLQLDEKGNLKVNGVSVNGTKITLDRLGNISFSGKLLNGTIDGTAKNIVENSGFEGGLTGTPTNWQYIGSSHNANTRIQGLIKLTGKSSLQIEDKTANGRKLNLGVAQQQTKLKSNQAYTFQAQILTDRLAPGTILRIGATDGKTSTHTDYTVSGTANWQLVTHNFTTKSTGFYPYFEVREYHGGAVFVDNTQLEEGSVATLWEPSDLNGADGTITSDPEAHIFPTQGGVGSVGTVDNRFDYLYVNNISAVGNVFLSDDVVLGDDSARNITINGQVNSNIVPDATNTYNLGSSALQWNIGYFKEIQAGTSTSIIGSTLSVQDLVINGNTTIGDSSSDTVTPNARFSGHLIPSANNTYDLGDNATPLRWRSAYLGTGLTVNNGATNTIYTNSNLTASGAYTIDSASTLSVNTTNNQAITTGTGLTTLGGDLAVNGTTSADITSTTTTATLFDSTVTTLTIGSAATLVDLADGATIKTIDIGGVTASGTDTINIATNSTAADVITIGNSNTATTVALTGGDDWSISTAGLITTAEDVAVNGGDLTTTAATFNLVNGTATTVNFASAATTLNLADAAIAGTIDIGGVTSDGTTTVNIATNGTANADTIAIGNSNASTTVAITGGDDWSITAGGAATFNGNVQIGNATSDTVAFTSVVASDFIRESSSTRNIGSSSVRWSNGYFENLDATNLVGTVVTGSTSAATWTINSDNISGDAEVSAVAFETGSANFNAVMQWNTASDVSRISGFDSTFVYNYPIAIYSQVSGANQTFTGGTLFKYSQPVAHAITQSAAFVGANIDFSSNLTVPNTASGNQTGYLTTLKNGGASATAIGFQTAGTFDIGLDIGGTPSTADIRLSNAESIDNLVNGTVNIGTTTLKLTGGTTVVSDQASVDLFNTTTTTLNVGGAGDVNLSGGSGSFGCTVTGSSGDLACSGNITGSTSGTIGFWSRSAPTLSPATANDIVSIANTTTTGSDLAITNTGIYTGTGLVAITANSATSGDILAISATALSTGSALTATGPTSTGVTDHFVKLTSDIGSSTALIYGAPDFSGAGVTAYGANITATDATTSGNTDYNFYSSLTGTGDAAKNLYGYYSTVTSNSTTAHDVFGGSFNATQTGAVAGGTQSVYGVYATATSSNTTTGGTTNVYGLYSKPGGTLTTAGTINTYGLYVDNSAGNTTGTSAKYGIYITRQTGSDTNKAFHAGGYSQGTSMELIYDAAVTQNGNLTGMSIDQQTNFTPFLTSTSSITGFNLLAPNYGTNANATTLTYDGYNISSGGSVTLNNAAAALDWDGMHVTTLNTTCTSCSSSVASGVSVTLGSVTTSGTQNGFLVTPPATTNAGSTYNGVNIGNISTSNGTDTAISIGSGWDAAVGFVGASDLDIPDNTASALTISQGTNNYFLITTTNDNEVVTLDLPAGGATSLTGNLFTSNINKTINIGTGTGVDTINIGTGATNSDAITLGNVNVATTLTLNSGSQTADVFTIAAASLTTGTAIYANGPSSTGVTDHFVKLTSDVGNAAALIYGGPDFSGSAATGYGVNITATDSTATGNADYAYYANLALTGNAAKTGYGYYGTVTSTSTTGDTLYGIDILTDHNGALAGATIKTLYGIRSQVTNDGITDNAASTVNVYGGYFDATGNGGGTQLVTGLYLADVSGGDTNVALCFDCDGTWTTSTVLAGIQFGTDANAVTLYRSASDTLKTDDGFIAAGGINSTAIGATSASTGAFTTLSSTGVTTLGNSSATVAIDSSDWDINTTGDMTGIGAITSNGLITGSLGLTITGATVSLNASSNFNVDIGTGTSTGDIAIGGGTAGQSVAINSEDWDITVLGAMTGIGAIGADGAVTVSPTTTGTFLDFALETEWTFGTLMNADFASATTQGAGDIIGLQFDFDTNLTGTTDRDITGTNVIMNALTATDTAVTTTYTGYNISAAGALDVAAGANAAVINWRGVNITMPAINTGAADTVSVTGMLITAGTVTDGTGTETSIAVDATDADIVTALSVGANPITGTSWNLNATTALTLGDVLSATNAATVAIFSSDWEISTTGAMTGIGAITADGLITGSGGLTLTGATAIAIGNNLSTVAIDSSDWDINTTGDMSGIGTIAANGKYTNTTGGEDILLSGATANRISWTTTGVAAPAFTSYSAGVKMVLYDDISASSTGYTLGIEGSNMFFTADTTSAGFKWYGGTTLAMTLTGAGVLTTVGDLTVKGENIYFGTTPSASINYVSARSTITAENGANSAWLGFEALNYRIGTTEVITNGKELTNIVVTGFETNTERLCWNSNYRLLGINGITDCTNSPGDYAEEYGTSDPNLAAADLVAVDPTRSGYEYQASDGFQSSKAWVVKTTGQYQTSIIGVVSTQPNDVIGQNFTPEENPRPITLSGRVPIKVSAENGAINIGDPITSSSTPGVGMKATQAGRIVGMALQSSDTAVGGKIIVFVNPGWFDPNQSLNQQGTLTYGGSPVQTDPDGNVFVELADTKKFELRNASGTIVSSISNTGEAFFNSLTLGSVIVKNAAGTTVAAIDNLGNAELNLITSTGLRIRDASGTVVASIDSLGNAQLNAIGATSLAIKDISGNLVASIDNLGNAEFNLISGTGVRVKGISGNIVAAIDSLGNAQLNAISSTSVAVRNATGAVVASIDDAGKATVNALDVVGNAQIAVIRAIPGTDRIAFGLGIGQKITVENDQGKQVASINDKGDAQFNEVNATSVNSERLTVDSLEASSAAIASLNAGSINSPEISGLQQETSNLTSNIQNLTSNPPSVFANGISALSPSSMASVAVAGIFTQDGSFVVDNGNSLNVIGQDLYLQNHSLAGKLNLFNGKVEFDKQGNLTSQGNIVAQTGQFTSLTAPEGQNLVLRLAGPINEITNSKLQITNYVGTEVASVDDQGNATFTGDISVGNKLRLSDSDHSLTLPNGTTATVGPVVGSITIPARASTFDVTNNQITDKSAIFLSPTSSTGPSNVFVSQKENGQGFTVTITENHTEVININYLIIN